MSDLNARAHEIIDRIEGTYELMSHKLHELEYMIAQERQKSQSLEVQLNQANQQINSLQMHEKSLLDRQTQLETDLLSLENVKNVEPAMLPQNLVASSEKAIDPQKIAELEIENKVLEEKSNKTYKMLQKEMVKVDTMQMELELAQRERDIALRKQSMTAEQKKLLIKLEHEHYKINEVVERIDYISDSLRTILNPEYKTQNAHNKKRSELSP